MKRFKLTEDWTATVVGWLIILLIVCQFKPTWPSFAWPDAEILLNKVIALDNGRAFPDRIRFYVLSGVERRFVFR